MLVGHGKHNALSIKTSATDTVGNKKAFEKPAVAKPRLGTHVDPAATLNAPLNPAQPRLSAHVDPSS